jgi:CelD/BcsL family acetyltransferase involved in cellulose biosynthesis
MSPDARRLRTTAMEWPDLPCADDLLAAWHGLLRAQKPPTTLYSSPRWLDHLVAAGDPGVLAIVVEDDSGKVVGAMPMRRERFALGREPISGLALSTLTVADLLGSVPLLPDDDDLARDALAGALSALPECDAILLDALPIGSRCYRLMKEPDRARRFFSYFSDPGRPAHALELGSSFDEYVARMRPKARYNLRRAVRKLEERGGLELVRTRLPDELDVFLNEASLIRRASWQRAVAPELGGNAEANRRHLSDLARRGLLRSYVLRSGGVPSAFVIGFQGDGVYYYWEIGYRRDLARFSPGTVLLYLLIEDLFASDPPAVLDFGKGDAEFKRRFGTTERPVATCLVLRPTLANAVRMHGHRLLRIVYTRLRRP